jgi:hypothetical protein
MKVVLILVVQLQHFIIEVGGRDINMAIGPLFDDITINVLYNVISTIVQQSITSVEMWVAYGGSTENRNYRYCRQYY